MPLTALHPNPRQPRTRFDDEAMAELAESIRTNGLLQPILVRPRPAGGYEIVAGERRYRAALRAGVSRAPIVVRNLSDEETLALALVENLIREDIGAMESARAFQRLMDDFGWSPEEVAQRVGKNVSTVRNTVRLLKLPADIQASLERGELTEGHARALLSGDSKERQRQVFQMIRNRGLSVRQTEALMKETAPPEGAAPAPRAGAARVPAGMAALEDRLRQALGAKVRLVGNEARGHIEIAYYTEDDLDRLLTTLAPEEGQRDAPPVQPPPTRGSDPIRGLLSSRRAAR